jgi:hypothetical protein
MIHFSEACRQFCAATMWTMGQIDCNRSADLRYGGAIRMILRRGGMVDFLANGHRTDKQALCRALLAAPTPDPPTPENCRERTRRLTGHALDVCPDCGGAMLEREPLPRRLKPHAPSCCDSS